MCIGGVCSMYIYLIFGSSKTNNIWWCRYTDKGNFKNYFVVHFRKLEKRHCHDDHYGSFANIRDAKTACATDAGCKAVYDAGCNETASGIHLCPVGTIQGGKESSCIYAKSKMLICT